MTRSSLLAAAGVAIFLSVILLGCAPESRCYEPVAINPLAGRAITFNACTGEYSVYTSPSATTTSTTIPGLEM